MASFTSSRRAADGDFQRIHIAHQAHAVADALLHLADICLLAPVKHIKAAIGQMIEAGIDFGVVVIDLDPILRKGVADALQIGMGEFHVVLFVDEADDVVEDENSFDRVAHDFVLGLEPVDDDAGAEVDELVTALRGFRRARPSGWWCCGRSRRCRAGRAR